jgi:hypothetical protein
MERGADAVSYKIFQTEFDAGSGRRFYYVQYVLWLKGRAGSGSRSANAPDTPLRTTYEAHSLAERGTVSL